MFYKTLFKVQQNQFRLTLLQMFIMFSKKIGCINEKTNNGDSPACSYVFFSDS